MRQPSEIRLSYPGTIELSWEPQLANETLTTNKTWNQREKNSRPEVFYQRGALKNFTNLTGKQLYQSLIKWNKH